MNRFWVAAALVIPLPPTIAGAQVAAEGPAAAASVLLLPLATAAAVAVGAVARRHRGRREPQTAFTRPGSPRARPGLFDSRVAATTRTVTPDGPPPPPAAGRHHLRGALGTLGRTAGNRG